MNIKESPEPELLLQLEKDVNEAEKLLAELKEEGYDLHSPAVQQARKILEYRLKKLNDSTLSNASV